MTRMPKSTALHPKEVITPAGLPELKGYSYAIKAGDLALPVRPHGNRL